MIDINEDDCAKMQSALDYLNKSIQVMPEEEKLKLSAFESDVRCLLSKHHLDICAVGLARMSAIVGLECGREAGYGQAINDGGQG